MSLSLASPGSHLACRFILGYCLMASMVTAYCAEPTADAPADGKIIFKDAAGKDVPVRVPVRRLICLSSDAAEIARAIGAGGRIVAVNSTVAGNPDFWPEHSKLPQIGGAFTPNVEAVAEQRPDLVVAYRSRPDESFEQKMKAFGIPVLRLDCFMPGEVAGDARLLGKVLGCEQGAEKLAGTIEKWDSLIRERTEKIPLDRRARVYVEAYGDFKGCGKGTGGSKLCAQAGAVSIADSLGTSYPGISTEWLFKENPQFIVKAFSGPRGCGADRRRAMEDLYEQMLARPGWSELEAVRKKRLYIVAGSVWLGPPSFISSLQLAKWFYPDEFDDVDPAAVYADYLKTFHGLDKDKAGAQFYP